MPSRVTNRSAALGGQKEQSSIPFCRRSGRPNGTNFTADCLLVALFGMQLRSWFTSRYGLGSAQERKCDLSLPWLLVYLCTFLRHGDMISSPHRYSCGHRMKFLFGPRFSPLSGCG